MKKHFQWKQTTPSDGANAESSATLTKYNGWVGKGNPNTSKYCNFSFSVSWNNSENGENGLISQRETGNEMTGKMLKEKQEQISRQDEHGLLPLLFNVSYGNLL